MNDEAVLSVRDLAVETASGDPIVRGVSFDLQRGEVLGIVGESGAGKTTLARAVFGYAHRGAQIAGGAVLVESGDLLRMGERELRRTRGTAISYVPQARGTALNPALRLSQCIADVLEHGDDGGASPERVRDLMERVGLPADERFLKRYPHQVSGGQQQRVSIAMALANRAGVVVLDEPTTGLDVVTQARIIDQLREIRESGVSMVYITHNLAVVTQIADRVMVLYGGSCVEIGPTREVLTAPRHPYTQELVNASPEKLAQRPVVLSSTAPAAVADGAAACVFLDHCEHREDACAAVAPPLETVDGAHEVRCLRWSSLPDVSAAAKQEPAPQLSVVGGGERDAAAADPAAVLEVVDLEAVHRGRRGAPAVGVAGISFAVRPATCLALMGESGSGKTTTARAVAGLHARTGGSVRLLGEEVASLAEQRSKAQLRALQLIFQSPSDSLNPRETVADAIARACRAWGDVDGKAAHAKARELLDSVRLSARLVNRYPRELSGGQCQRVSIARALATSPQVLVCDEITSALDVAVQASILQLLGELQRERGMAVLLITHDVGVAAATADHVMVLQHGQLCESGDVEQVLGRPSHPYTQSLIAATPTVDQAFDQGSTDLEVHG